MNDVESKILVLRDQRVILDCDVAALYGISTIEINQAVKNNPENSLRGTSFKLTPPRKRKWSKILTTLPS